MTREEIFDIWSPAHSPWSPWVKPVLFAHIPDAWSDEPAFALPAPPDLSFLQFPSARTALLIDLPGETAIPLALALAYRGLRPIPLYNGVPSQSRLTLAAASITSDTVACVNTWPIVAALFLATHELVRIPIPADAPPVFLLDSRRRLGDRAPLPGTFDNRWISFPTDFPSAGALRDHHIDAALLLTQAAGPVPADLAHTLSRWQAAGIPLHHAALDAPAAPAAITLRSPTLFQRLLYTVQQTFGLRRHPLGGFGGSVPDLSSSG
jgi:hypothetical protein